MRFTVDTDRKTLEVEAAAGHRILPLYSQEAFEILSDEWLRVGWSLRHSYTFTWMGRPIIQLPQDLLRVQEVLFDVKPDLLIETGVAHGGSLVFYASLFAAMGKGRVLGVELSLRPANAAAIRSHPLHDFITLIEGGSTDGETLQRVSAEIPAGGVVMVMLDSNHSKAHVARELELYSQFVTPGSYIVASDGIMEDLADVPGGVDAWREDNPAAAAREFAANHPEFELVQPPWKFNESQLKRDVTQWKDAWLRRIV